MQVGGDPRIGTVLAGYRIEALLGRGSQGAVYLAEDVRLGRRVALRVVNLELTADERFRERVLRESALVGELGHPSIVPVYEAGEADGQVFVATGYVEGSSLAGLLTRDGRLEPTRALGIVEQLAGALDAARWGRGLVHGGARPSEVLIVPSEDADSDERVVLGGFGLRRELPPGATLTEAAQHLGTVDCLAPEQIEGRPIRPRVDVYALGCVLFECLTGRPPFPGVTPEAVLEAHLHEQPPSVAHLRAGLPAGIDDVIGKATAKWPEERYSTCAELAAAARVELMPLGEEPEGARAGERRRTVGFSPPRKPVPTPSAPVSYRAGVDSAAPPGSPARRLARRSWASISAVGLVALLALAAATVWAVGRGTDEASLAPPAPPTREPLGQVAGAGVPNDRVPPALPAEPTGDGPRGLLVSLGPGLLVRIDARTGRTLASVPIPFPRQVASDGRSVWALGAEGLGKRVLLTRVESTTATATDIFDAGAYPPAPLGFAVAAGRAWFSDEDGNGYRFARDASASEPVRLDPASRYFYLPFAAAGSLWVSSPPFVLRVDPSTGQVRARLDGIAVVVAAGKGFLWALNYTAREIVRVDTKTNATAPVGRVAFQWADLAVADGAVWASDPQDNAIVRLDPVTGLEIERIHLGRQPGALASGGGALWIALPWAGAVTRYDIASGRTETIDVGGTPTDVVFARGSVWVGVEVLTREAYVASAEAICKAASGRFLAAVAALDLPHSTRSLDDVAAFHEVAVRFSEETLGKLRALREPKAGRATLRNDLVLREQEIDLMRKIVDAAAAGDAARAEELGRERVELTHRRSAYLPSECPLDLPA